MSSLRNVEDTIGGFVERIFGRLFRGHVEPVELARKLAREMEDHKTVSVSRVYVPNEYVVYLSQSDRERFTSFEGSLTTELGLYVSERARHEGFTLLSPPKVRLETDTDLRVGEYGIACRVVDPPAEAPAEVDASANLDDGVALEGLTRFPPAPPEPPAAFIAPEPVVAPEAPAEADEPDPFLEPAAQAAEGAIADELPDAPEAAVDELARDSDGAAAADGAAIEEAPEIEPDGDPVAGIDRAVDAEAEIAGDGDPSPEVIEPADPEPRPLPAVPPPDLVPEPVAEAPAVPLPTPGGYEPLAGVSGTQIISAADARAEGLVSEEVSLIFEGRRHRVTQRTTTLGRSRDCDIVVQDANASRQHAEIRHIGLDYFLVDLGSTNGTIVNGQRIRRHPLAHGDRILIGTTEIAVEHLA